MKLRVMERELRQSWSGGSINRKGRLSISLRAIGWTTTGTMMGPKVILCFRCIATDARKMRGVVWKERTELECPNRTWHDKRESCA